MNLLSIGDVLGGKYHIEEVLGEGGFGCVYRGRTELSERAVAIKVLKPGQQGYDLQRTQRFFRELRAIGKLQSPHTLTLFDYGKTDDGLLYMVTEFIDGKDLDEVLDEHGTLSEAQTAHIVMQMLRSLEEAHRVGILHRDIKPSNIRIFRYQDDPFRAKLLDFGLAWSLRADESRLTGTGKVIGTPRYMSPEQIRGRELTGASDIYSLGFVALECVQGRSSGRPTTSIDADTNISPRFRDVLQRMLAEDPTARFRSAHDAFNALQAPTEPMAPRPARVASVREPRSARRRPPIADARTPRSTLVAGAALIGSALIALWLFTREPAPEPPPTTTVVPSAILRGQPQPKSPPTDEARELPSEEDRKPVRKDGCGVEPAFLGEVVLRTPGTALGEASDIFVYLPTSYDAEHRHPVILAFHDYPGGPRGVMRRSQLQYLSDDHGVIIVAVQDVVTDLHGIWDSPSDARRAHDALLGVAHEYCTDRSRVFAYGHGDGGRGVEHLMCQFDDIAAAATTSYRPESTGAVRCRRSKPRLQIDPQDHPGAPSDGRTPCGMLFHPMLSTQEYEDELRGRAGCKKQPSIWMKHAEGTCRTWSCGTPLVACRVRGGREFAGTTPRKGLGAKSCDGGPGKFPYTEAIWRFFQENAPAKPTD